jgi:hypothetical protein
MREATASRPVQERRARADTDPVRIRVAALVAVFLLSACGTRTADPPAEAARSEGQEVARRLLATMVVPQEDVGGLPLGLRVSPESGWKDNRAEAESSLDPDDSAVSLRQAGRVTGYELAYYDPTQQAIRAGSGIATVMTWVDLFTSGDAASASLRGHVDYALARAGTSPREGVSFGAVKPFEAGVPGEAYGLRESVEFAGDRVVRTILVFRRGRLVAGSMVVRADTRDGAADARRMAGILDQRIQIALRGGSNGEPVLIPEDGVPLDGQQPTPEQPPGGPDLAAVALGPDDVPAGFLCDQGRYTRTQPPRITFRRTFCPQGAAVGRTRLLSLSSQVSVFESEVAAQASLTLTAAMMTSADGAKTYAANFAATSGLVATHVRRRQVTLPGGRAGVLTAFRTKVGRLAGFSALTHRGRGLATLDAIGLADGFDHTDLLPLLHTVERRLGQLE